MNETNNTDPRSIDALVDKHIFGRKLSLDRTKYFDEGLRMWVEVKHYSEPTDTAAAMEVVDKLGVEEFGFTKLRNGLWECALMVLEGPGFAQYRATAPTREMAICLAALRANGITI